MQKQSFWELMLVCCRILCWGGDTLDTPRCHRCAAAQLSASLAPELCQQVLASHTSPGDGCSVANGDALLPAGCKQELFFPARGQGSPAPCIKGCSSPPATVGQGALMSCLLPCAAHTVW